MSQVFIRRTTAGLLALIAALVILCVALLVLLFAPDWKEDSTSSTSSPIIDTSKPHGGGKPQKELTEPWEKNFRIPEATLPIHYDLYLHPDLERGTFSGHVDTLIQISSRIDYLVTHTKYLDIFSTEVFNTNGNKREIIKDAFEYEPNEFWVVKMKSHLRPGNYTLKLKFNGSLERDIVGFYKSVYSTAAGKKRYDMLY